MKYVKRIKLFIVAIVWFSVTQISFANGGPGVIRDVVVGGHAYFNKVDEVVLEREDLTFDINQENMNVNVVYTLTNQGEERDIDYIFPVTRYMQGDDVIINDFKILDNSEIIPFSVQDEESDMTEEEHQYVIDTYGYDTREFGGDMKTTYYITTLHFGAGEKKQVAISYSIIGQYDSYGTSKRLLETYSDTSYYYDLTPASYWGNGIVGEFNLKIDYQDILKYQSMNVNIPDFLRDDTGIFIYNKKQYDLAQQKNIILSYYHPYELKELEKYHISADSLDRIYVSSTLPPEGKLNYSLSQMFDHNMDTGWVEGSEGLGIGDSIELLFEESRGRVIGIINGYTKSRETYYNNARIKKIKVEAFQFESKDELYNPLSVREEIYELKDIPYDQISKELYYNNVQFIGNLDGGLAYHGYMRITILEVYPGNKYEDTAISEMVFFEHEYTWDPYTFKKGYTISNEPIFKINDKKENDVTTNKEQENSDDAAEEINTNNATVINQQDEEDSHENMEREEEPKNNTTEINKTSERSDSKVETSISQDKRENDQNQLAKKQQMKTTFVIACAIVIIILAGYMIYIVRNNRS